MVSTPGQVHSPWHDGPKEEIVRHPVVEGNNGISCGSCSFTGENGVYWFDRERKNRAPSTLKTLFVAARTAQTSAPT